MRDRKNRILLFVDDGSRPLSDIRRYLGRMPHTHISYIGFRDYLSAEEKEKLINCAENVVILDTVSRMREVSFDFRTQIVQWLKELPQKPLPDGRSLLNRWMKDGTSLWWYTELSQKNSFGRPIYWQLLHLEVIGKIIENLSPQYCYAACRPDFSWGLSQVCSRHRITWIGKRPIIRPKRWRFLLQRFWVMICVLATTLLAKFYAQNASYDNIRRFSTRRHRLVAFTWYPRVWGKRYSKWQDMYYEDLPESLEKDSNINWFYMLRLFDALPAVYPAVYFRRIKKLFSRWEPNQPWAVLECFSSLFEICRQYLDVRDFIRFLHLEQSIHYRNLFVFNGINVYPLVAEDMWRSVLIHWPHMELLSRRVHRVVSRIRPQVTLLYCFEYIYGRAIAHGLRREGGSTIFGMQHGPIAHMKLIYATDAASMAVQGNESNPHPDVFLVDGPLAKDILIEGGISPKCIHSVGPIRFNRIWPRAAGSCKIQRFRKPPIRILIAPGHSDTEFVLKLSFDALRNDNRVKLMVKLHPKVFQDRFEQVISQYPDIKNERIMRVEEGSIYDWMERADILLATYSSTAVEAIVFGLPVIMLESGRVPDQSPFSWDNSPVLRAKSPEDLKHCIDRLTMDNGYRIQYLKDLLQEAHLSFGAIDDKEIDRTMDLIKSAGDSDSRAINSFTS